MYFGYVDSSHTIKINQEKSDDVMKSHVAGYVGSMHMINEVKSKWMCP